MRFLRSKRALYAVVSLFALESLWIALSSRFPMAFDEYAHFGIAQLHTETLWPFLNNLPDSTALYGPVPRDASFLYHYVLSFPLHVLQLLTDNLTTQIIMLRILNIGVACMSLLVYAKLLRTLGVSWFKTNIIMLFVILIPVMPLMAGQISYDNLFFLLVATVLLLGVRFVQAFQNKGVIDARLLSWMLLAGLYTCFVKYAFLPAMVAIVLCLGSIVFRNRQKTRLGYRQWWQSYGRRSKILFITLFVIGVGLFSGSYGVNLVTYHSPIPDCAKVYNQEACKAYGPWYRDYLSKQSHPGSTIADVPPYVKQWFKQMMEETFFLVGAKYKDDGVVAYRSVKPLHFLLLTGWILFTLGAIIALMRSRIIWQRQDFRLLCAVLLLYTLFLFARNLQFYLETGAPVAIHGRYVLPFLIPVIGVIAVVAQGMHWRQWHVPRGLKLGFITLATIMFLQGGLFTFIVSSTDDWMWPQSQPAKHMNHTARNLLEPFVYR